MKYRRLGVAGPSVSRIVLSHNATVAASVPAALDAGITAFDVADPHAELLLAGALRGRPRGSLRIIAALPGSVPLTRQHVFESCRATLHRLGTDHVDVYQVPPTDDTPQPELLSALDALVGLGAIGHVGVANWTARQLTRAFVLATELGLRNRIVAHRPLDVTDCGIVSACRELGIGQLATAPHHYAAAVRSLAENAGLTAAQLGTAWLLRQPTVAAAIVAPADLAALDELIVAAAIDLDDDLLATLATLATLAAREIEESALPRVA